MLRRDISGRRSAFTVPAVAARQAGVFTAAQASAEGWTARQIQRRLENERWTRLLGKGLVAATAAPRVPGVPGVLGVPGGSPRSGPDRPDPRQLGYAAVLTIPDAVISHTTAALLHGWPLPGTRQDAVHVVSMRAHASPPGLRVHADRLPRRAVIDLGPGLPVTVPRRTAADLLCLPPEADGLDLWAWLSSRGVMTLPLLRELIELRAGRPGVLRLRALAARVRYGAASPAEERLHEVMRAGGLAGWQAGIQIVDQFGVIGVVDVLFAARALVIEVDGWRAHGTRSAFVNDRRRQNRLVAAGYTVLRFTWDDLTQHPGDVLAQIHAALS